jgi:hypothetical protein
VRARGCGVGQAIGAAAFAVLVLVGASDAAAQPVQPVGGFVIDTRGTLARFKGSEDIAAPLGVTADDLPTRGLGIAVGAHWYPLRLGRVSFGVGGEVLFARDRRTAEATTERPEPPTITTRFSVASPQVSVNFGKREGWSYLSGGLGLASLKSDSDAAAFTGDAGRVRTTHYGGGARWFTGPHVAFTFDLRFYTINEQAAAGTRPAYPRSRMMVISVGASFR